MKALAKLLLVLVLLPVGLAYGDEFDCVRNLMGGTVKWDMDWQRDRADQDVTYRIVNITESQIQRNLREIAVELLAVGSAKIPKRVSRMRMDYAAEMFCKRGTVAVKEASTLVRASVKSSESAPSKGYSPAELPFRTLEMGRWRAKRIPSGVPLRVCVTKDSLFSCTDSDFQKLTQTAVDGRVHHEHPFIRFIDGGWVRGQETDLTRVGEISTCTAMGRNFSCLAEEKNAFPAQLKKISERKI